MSTRTPIERTTKIATTVEMLEEAWVFVMSHIDEVGPNPSVGITPVWSYGEEPTVRRFEVVVTGMVEDGVAG